MAQVLCRVERYPWGLGRRAFASLLLLLTLYGSWRHCSYTAIKWPNRYQLVDSYFPATMSYHHQLIEFLRTDLAVPAEAIALGQRQTQDAAHLLPVVLWQYGLVSTFQLEQIFEWVEQQPVAPRLELISSLNTPPSIAE